MATFRTLATVGAALCAGLLLYAPAEARDEATTTQTAAANRAPLKLTPPTQEPRKATRAATTKKPQRRAATVNTAAAKKEPPAIMRGEDSVGLIAMLPWWRSDPMQAIRYREKEAESQVLTSAEAWLAPGSETASVNGRRLASSDEFRDDEAMALSIGVVDPHDLNELDIAATDSSSRPANQSWLGAMLAMLGGALAAVSTARFLFV
jgi:hypothetical protein